MGKRIVMGYYGINEDHHHRKQWIPVLLRKLEYMDVCLRILSKSNFSIWEWKQFPHTCALIISLKNYGYHIHRRFFVKILTMWKIVEVWAKVRNKIFTHLLGIKPLRCNPTKHMSCVGRGVGSLQSSRKMESSIPFFFNRVCARK